MSGHQLIKRSDEDGHLPISSARRGQPQDHATNPHVDHVAGISDHITRSFHIRNAC